MKLKTWEMMKMLSENPNLKFVCDSYTAEVNKINGLLYLKYANRDSRPSGNIRLIDVNSSEADEWELVQEPVDFMAAVNSGKLIKYETWNDYHDLDFVLNLLKVRPKTIKMEWLNGKWYIEE